ncbi:hypothetical protein TCAL_01790 [Tigriopus californicus]|uniref:Fanconi anemia group M protein n=1 Tax=Tigriopus californicus TaxID=6832 RepID=A0A553N7H5_TIGCA|nr:hypothetical protein TCAL_01790 [Tigriopus californicus]
MSQRSGRQTTLFQTWGYEGNMPNEASPIPSNTSNAQRSSHFTGHASIFKSPDPLANIVPDEEDDHLGDEEDDAFLSLALEESLAQRDFDASIASGTTQPPVLPVATPQEDLPGFDVEAGRSWVYPINYTLRTYQFDIVKACLYQNTLVTLPTGLGKTFIAAVVMYNFFRWYPSGKVVFMAPTKPLVAQQIEACFKIMGIPQSETMEMTGNVAIGAREKAWKCKRVLFMTPQVMSNDLSRGLFPSRQVKLLVVDEAHRAQGDYAYCQVVRELQKSSNPHFRVVALSATPGSDIQAVRLMLQNLMISHIELRSEDSPDIVPYTFQRSIEKVVVPLGQELTCVKNKFLTIMEHFVRRLAKNGALIRRGNSVNPTHYTKFGLLQSRNEFRQNPPATVDRTTQGVVEGDFASAISLYHAYELLLQHGMRTFFNFLTKSMDEQTGNRRLRYELNRLPVWHEISSAMTEKFVEDPKNAKLNSSRPQLLTQFGAAKGSQETNLVLGHPKLERLREMVLDHFKAKQAEGLDTKVMIFSQYRDSVQEITACLHFHRPLIKVMEFVGQAGTKGKKGLSQKEQIEVVKRFREGGFNTLVATCVGEEGLDIGEIDLIVCYDVSKSPIRLVQRMGRTGRKRAGRIIVLVTEGKEENTYNQSMYSKNSISKAILEKHKLASFLTPSPRMVPKGMNPICHKMSMIERTFQLTGKDKKAKSGGDQGHRKISGMLGSTSTGGTSFRAKSGFLDTEELAHWQTHYYVPEETVPVLKSKMEYWALEKEPAQLGRVFDLSEWILWQDRKPDRRFLGESMSANMLFKTLSFIQKDMDFSEYDSKMRLWMASEKENEDIGETRDERNLIKKEIPRVQKVKENPVLALFKQQAMIKGSSILPYSEEENELEIIEVPQPVGSPPEVVLLDDGNELGTDNPDEDKDDENDKLFQETFEEIYHNLRIPKYQSPPSFERINAQIASMSQEMIDALEFGFGVKEGSTQTFFTTKCALEEIFSHPEQFVVQSEEHPCISPVLKATKRHVSTRKHHLGRPLSSTPTNMGETQRPQDQRSKILPCLLDKSPIETRMTGSPTPKVNHSKKGRCLSFPSSPQIQDQVHDDSLNALFQDSSIDLVPNSMEMVPPRDGHDQIDAIEKSFSSKGLFDSWDGASQNKDEDNDMDMSECMGPSTSRGQQSLYSATQLALWMDESTTPSKERPRKRVASKFQFEPEIDGKTVQGKDALTPLKHESELDMFGSDDEDAFFANLDVDEKSGGNHSISAKRFKLPNLSEYETKCSTPKAAPGVHKMKTIHPNAEISIATSHPTMEAPQTQNSPVVSHLTSKRQNKRRLLVLASSSSSEDENDLTKDASASSHFSIPESVGAKNREGKSRRKASDFLELEAALSGEAESDEDCDGDDHLDGYDASFVDDRQTFNQSGLSDEKQRLVYLKSVRSPTNARDFLKASKNLRPITEDIFSQMPEPEEPVYQADSFCVGSDEEIEEAPQFTQLNTMDLLADTSGNQSVLQPRNLKSKTRLKQQFEQFYGKRSSKLEDQSIGSNRVGNEAKAPKNRIAQGGCVSSSEDESSILTSPKASVLSSSYPTRQIAGESVPSSNQTTAVPSTSEPVKMLQPELNQSLEDDQKLTVLVNSSEVHKIPNLISCLRHEHGFAIQVRPFEGAAILLSPRTAVDRITAADFTNGANRHKIVERCQRMNDLFERPCLLIETERNGESVPRTHRSKYYDLLLSQLSQSKILYYFTQSQMESASVLGALLRGEEKKKFLLPRPLKLSPLDEQILAFYQTLPGVGLGTALQLVHGFSSLGDLARSAPATIMNRTHLSEKKAREIQSYFRRAFEPDLTHAGNR